MISMKALVLCGGFATRLEPLTYFVPKPLLPLGGKPILDYIIERIDITKSVDTIYISTNRKFFDQFLYWHKRHRKKNMKLIEEPALHEGEKFGAIKGIMYAIKKARIKDDLLVIAGDNVFDFDVRKLINDFRKRNDPIIALYNIKSKEEARRFGVVRMYNGKVVKFSEKPSKPDSTLVSTGIYIIPKEALHYFDEYLRMNNHPDSPGYFIQWLSKRHDVAGRVYRGKWFDIGTIDTYQEVFDTYE
jgi:glucose-1-phosphate thymidylyltransferase